MRTMTDTDADTFLAVSRKAFAPLYPFYAAQFLDHSGITRGRCLDLGCGGGDLGLAVTARSALSLILLDRAPTMVQAASQLAAAQGLAGRTLVLEADVHELPLAEASVDLIVSRGSLMFWKDLPRAFADIYRVLSGQGRAYIGGGLGSPEMRQAICREMAKHDSNWRPDGPPPPRPGTDPGRHEAALRTAGIEHFAITREDTGHWIELWKEERSAFG